MAFRTGVDEIENAVGEQPAGIDALFVTQYLA
jgi:hypothetical protein